MGRSMVWMLAGLAACGGRSFGQCYGETDELSATVDLDGEPVFDWELGSAYALSVDEVDDRGESVKEMWHVQCGGDNNENDEEFEEQVCIETPIAYGEEVDSPFFDTVNFTRPKELEAGKTYRLSIYTLTEEDGVRPPADEWDEYLTEWLPEGGDNPHCGSTFMASVDFVLP